MEIQKNFCRGVALLLAHVRIFAVFFVATMRVGVYACACVCDSGQDSVRACIMRACRRISAHACTEQENLTITFPC